MIECALLLLCKKFLYAIVNLFIVVGLLSWFLGKIRPNPKLRIALWSLALGRFFFDFLWHHENTFTPSDLGGPGEFAMGVSTENLSALFFRLRISEQSLSFGDLTQLALGSHWLVIIGALFLTTALFSAVRTITSYFKLSRKSRSYDVIGEYEEVRVRLCDQATSPYVIGFRDPNIVVPAQLLTHCDESEITAILAHERAHVTRWDHITVPILLTIRSLFVVIRPLGRVIAELIQSIELLCDRKAAAKTGVRPVLRAINQSLGCLVSRPCVTATFGPIGIRERIRELQNPSRQKSLRENLLFGLIGLFIVSIRIL